VLRSGARKGDWIYVTGALGGSLRGKHLKFEPRIEEGLWLREYGWANAMIDISDGLVTDLGHVLESSKVGAELRADWIPVSADARKMRGKRSPLERALFDGEDFELLFTVSPDRKMVFESSWEETFVLPCTCVGRITGKASGLTVVSGGRAMRVKDAGYQHFVT
jgi:thiamine-monophosphate kinase